MCKFPKDFTTCISAEKLLAVIQPLEKGEFYFSSLEEAQCLSDALATLCPNREDASLGLSELMINGIEHGNLEITYDEKNTLIQDGKWREEIDHRLSLPQYLDRTVHILFERSPTKIKFTITDEGIGFDPTRFLVPEPNRDLKGFHGRGIKVAAEMCFNHLEYLGKGNQVKATIFL